MKGQVGRCPVQIQRELEAAVAGDTVRDAIMCFGMERWEPGSGSENLAPGSDTGRHVEEVQERWRGEDKQEEGCGPGLGTRRGEDEAWEQVKVGNRPRARRRGQDPGRGRGTDAVRAWGER